MINYLERAKGVPANNSPERLEAIEKAQEELLKAGVVDPVASYPGVFDHAINLLSPNRLIAIAGSTLARKSIEGQKTDLEIAQNCLHEQVINPYYQALRAVGYDAALSRETDKVREFSLWNFLRHRKQKLMHETYHLAPPTNTFTDGLSVRYNGYLKFNSELPACPVYSMWLSIEPADSAYTLGYILTRVQSQPVGYDAEIKDDKNIVEAVNLSFDCIQGAFDKLTLKIPTQQLAFLRRLAANSELTAPLAELMNNCFVFPEEDVETSEEENTQLIVGFRPSISVELSQVLTIDGNQEYLSSIFDFASLETGWVRNYHTPSNRRLHERLGIDKTSNLQLLEMQKLLNAIFGLIPGPRS